jgi:hypothetical protein
MNLLHRFLKKKDQIVINTGVPKSGTTLLQQYQIDLVNTFFSQNGQNEIIKFGYKINDFSEINNRGFFSNIDNETYNLFKRIYSKHGSFVIKTHCLPNPFIEMLIHECNAKITCCFRDPRDIILSAIDHGMRTRNGLDKTGAYHDVFTIDDGILRIKKWIKIFDEWNIHNNVLMIKYEDLISNKQYIINEVKDFMKINIPQKKILEIYSKHENIKESAWNFNVGTTFRWKTEMSKTDIEKCNLLLKSEILKMGYDL